MSVKTFFSKKLTAFQILHFKVSNCTFSLCIPSVQSQTAKMISSTICKCFKVLQFALLQITHSNTIHRTEYFCIHILSLHISSMYSSFNFTYVHMYQYICICMYVHVFHRNDSYKSLIRNIFGNVFP